MTFLNPWMLMGGLAAGIPLALHFFYRANYRPVPWAAMKFLRLALEQTSRRLRFQELILLLLRIAVCLLLAFALARPASNVLTASSGRGDSVDAVIIIDTSYSMSAIENEKTTRLDKAKEAALKIIDNLPPNSTVQIVSCSSQATNLGPRSPSNLDQGRNLVNGLKTSSLSTNFLDGFTAAYSALEHLEGATKEVYLISDMQRSGWERETSAVRAKCEQIKNQASLYLVRCTEATVQNVAIVGILSQTEIPHANSIVAFTVLLRNSGSAPVENLDVTLTVAGQKKEFQKASVAVAKVDAGETRAVTISGLLEKPGWQLLTARINEPTEQATLGKKDDGRKTESKRNRTNEDAIEEDNTFSVIIQVYEKIRVLVVDGAPDELDPSKAASFYVGNALLPIRDDQRSEYHLSAAIINPEDFNKGSLEGYDVCVFANVAADQLSSDSIKALEAFVRSGKALMIGTGSNVVGADYNAAFGGLLPAPLLDTAAYETPEENRAAADLSSIDIYSFLSKLTEKGNSPLTTLSVAWTAAITPVVDPAAATNKDNVGRVLLRFTDGRPMLLGRNVGAGEVMMLTTSLDKSWSVLCKLPAFTPFINACVAHMIERSNEVYNHTAGQALKWTPPDLQQEYFAVPPEGERVSLGKADEKDQFRLPAFDTSRAGIYRIVGADTKEKDAERFVFNPDLSESENLEAISDEQIDKQLDFKPVHLTTGFDGKSFTGTERSRSEWTIWALMALLFFLLGETLFAWFCGRAW